MKRAGISRRFVAVLLLCFWSSVAHGQELVTPLLDLPWDSSSTSPGRIDPRESDAEGPASFLVANDVVLILDQVRKRVLQFDRNGRPVGEISLPTSTLVALDRLPDGRLLLLDRLVNRELLVYDAVLGMGDSVPVEGPYIEDAGTVTALFVRTDGVWLEVGHEYSVRLLDEAGHACPRAVIPGRPSQGGPASLVAKLTGPQALEVALVDGTKRARWQTTLTFAQPLERIVWVEDLPDGRTVVVAHTRNPDTGAEQLLAHRLDKAGAIQSVGAVPYRVATWYLQREIRVLPDGHLQRMWYDDAGVHLESWRLP
jgi:hypothetical protein